MKQQHPIDDLFSSKLKQHAVEPPMHLWENIDKGRDRKKALLAKGGQKKYWALLGLLLVSGLALWMYLPTQNATAPLMESNMMTQGQKAKVQIANNENQITNSDSQDSNHKNQVTNNNSQDSNQAISTKEGGVGNVNINKQKTNVENQDSNQKSQHINRPTVTKKAGYQNTNTKAQPSNSPIAEKPGAVDFNTTNNALANEAAGENPTSAFVESTEKETSLALAKNTIEKQGFLQPENVIKVVPKNALKLLSYDVSGSLNLIPKETDCPTFSGLSRGLYLDVNASIDVAQRTMRSRFEEMDSYLEKRKETELPYFAFSTSVHLTALSNRGFALKSGIDYTQINEYFSYENGYEVETVITNVFENDVIIGYDTVVNIGIRRITAVNRYKMIDIPLLVGYELDLSNFSLNVYGGPILNVVFNKKGSFLSPMDAKPTGVIEKKPKEFKMAFQDKLGVGWYTSFGFAYKLRKGTQIRFEPYFRVYPKSFTKESFPVEQKYFLTGIKIGVRQRL